MRSENGFRHGAGLKQAETKQNGVADNAPNGVDGIPGNRHALDQHRINRHADEDEKALKTQRKQAFQVVLPHVRLLVVAPCCHGDGRKAHHAVDFNHTPVDDHKNDNAQDPHGDADEEGLQKQPEQGAYIHLHQAGLQHGQTNVIDTGVSGNDAAGIGHHLLGDVEHRYHDVKSIVFVGGRREQVETEETDSAAHDAAIKDRNEILNDKDKVIREAEAAVNEAKARVHETRSEVLDGRQQREAIRLEEALRKLEETRENQAKEIKEASSRTLDRLQDELLGKVEDCSYNVVSMVKSYLWERQKSYIQMVQDLVNISLNEELSKKKSELEKLIQTIQSKGEEREKALNDAKINLEKTKKLMDQGALLQVQLESGESAKIDMEKV